jgi:prophage regulatory protein
MPPKPSAAQDPWPGKNRRSTASRVANQSAPCDLPGARAPPGRLYTFQTLAEKGITFSKNYLRKLVKEGKFPAPIYLSERRPAWTEAMLDAWIAQRASTGRSS